eukprot:1452304-Pleurochrysis_carterae.AAC.2
MEHDCSLLMPCDKRYVRRNGCACAEQSGGRSGQIASRGSDVSACRPCAGRQPRAHTDEQGPVHCAHAGHGVVHCSGVARRLQVMYRFRCHMQLTSSAPRRRSAASRPSAGRRRRRTSAHTAEGEKRSRAHGPTPEPEP